MNCEISLDKKDSCFSVQHHPLTLVYVRPTVPETLDVKVVRQSDIGCVDVDPAPGVLTEVMDDLGRSADRNAGIGEESEKLVPRVFEGFVEEEEGSGDETFVSPFGFYGFRQGILAEP